MDLEILKKKISTFRGDGGLVRHVSDEVLMEILKAWEEWTGPAKGFASAIGMNRNSLPKLIGKAKKLKREGHFPVEDFKEIRIEQIPPDGDYLGGVCKIELTWDGKQVIRFGMVDQLIDFLKKSGANAA
jgi:hypothetical protein